VEAEKARILGEKKFSVAQQLLSKLDKEKIDQMKRSNAPKKPIIKVLKCALLILVVPSKNIKNGEEIRAAIKGDFLKQLQQYEPTKKQKKSKLPRISQILESMDEEVTRKTSTACYLLYQYLANAVALRHAAIAVKKEDEDEEEEEEEKDDTVEDLTNE
jgi:hypothetical protein